MAQALAYYVSFEAATMCQGSTSHNGEAFVARQTPEFV